MTGTIVEYAGTYTFDEVNNILKLYSGNNYCLHDFKVCKLTDSELWLAIPEPLSGEYMFDDLMGIKCRRATQADNIPDFIRGTETDKPWHPGLLEQPELNISAPEVQDITNNSAVIKSTVLGDNIKGCSIN